MDLSEVLKLNLVAISGRDTLFSFSATITGEIEFNLETLLSRFKIKLLITIALKLAVDVAYFN